MGSCRELLLLRHGIAEGRRSDGSDTQRSLTAEGRERTARVIGRLVAMDLHCDLLLSSPLVRARQTAELARELGLAPALELEAALAPGHDPQPLLQRWLGPGSPRPGWRRLALVGHEPDLGLLAARLMGVPPDLAEGALKLRKAGAMLLQWPGSDGEALQPGGARLALLLSPKSVLVGC